MARRLPALLVALSLVAPACGEDDPASPADPGPPPPPIAAESFAAAYADASCGQYARCFNVAPYLMDNCRKNVLDFLGEDVTAGIAAGRLTYDEAAAGKCVAGVAATRCVDAEPNDETIAACLAALKGTVAAGKPCYSPFECAAGFCPTATEVDCPAVCPETVGKGEACSLLTSPECDARAGLRCSAGTCVLPGGEDAACVDNYGCASGFVCVASVCEPLRQKKFGCAKDSSCADGLFCVAEGDEGGICEPRLGEGAACGGTNTEENNAAFRGVQCAEGLVCKGVGLTDVGLPVGGVCTKPVGEGGECSVEPSGLQMFLTGCLDGLDCPAGKCVLPPSSGACSPHGFCRPDTSYCDANNTCAPLKKNGDVCTYDPECDSYACIGGVCIDAVTYCGP